MRRNYSRLVHMSKLLPVSFFNGSSPIALVVGAGGFIGSHLTEALLEKEVKVLYLDSLSGASEENISRFLENNKFAFLKHDIQKKIPREIERIDYLIYLAGVESNFENTDAPTEILEKNSEGVKNLLDFAKEKNARFILASTIGVYSAPVAKEKTRGEERFSFNEALRFAEALVKEYGKENNLDARIARVADVYGPRMSVEGGSLFAKLVQQTIHKRSLVLPGRGDQDLYLVYVSDIVEGLVKCLFASGLKNSIVSLVGPKTSAYYVARTLEQVSGSQLGIKYDGESKEEQKTEEIQTEGISWAPKVGLPEGVRKTLDWFEKKYPTPRPIKEKPQEENLQPEPGFWSGQPKKISLKGEPEKQQEAALREPKSAPGKLIVLFFAAACGVLAWFFLLPLAQFTLGVTEAKFAQNSLMSSDSKKAEIWASGSLSWFRMSEEGFLRWRSLPFIKNEADFLTKTSRILAGLAGVEKDSSQALAEAKVLARGISGEEAFSSRESAEKLSLELTNLARNIAFLEAELGQKDLTISFGFKEVVLARLEDLSGLRRTVSGVSDILATLPTLLGERERKIYLVILQDNSKQRPSGGVLVNFALATFEKGRLVNYEIQDVDSTDAELKGRVDPPNPLKDNLGVKDWLLKDASWSPDFPTTASRAAWFIDKELGQKINGVVSIDTDFIRELTALSGGLVLNSGEKITRDNIDEKIHDKKIQGELLRSTILLLLKSPEDKVGPISKTLVIALQEKHLMVWTDVNEANSMLTKHGWDGSIKKVDCPEEVKVGAGGCYPDYLQIAEASLGNSAPDLAKSHALDITLASGKMSHRLTINYKNKGEDFKDYLRIYTQAGSKLSFAAIIDVDSGKQEELKIDESQEKGKSVFGSFLTVPHGKNKEIVFIWEKETNPAKFPDKGNLVFFWQKQAGAGSNPTILRINLPEENYAIELYPRPSLTQGGAVSYNTSLTRDLLVNLIWQPK